MRGLYEVLGVDSSATVTGSEGVSQVGGGASPRQGRR